MVIQCQTVVVLNLNVEAKLRGLIQLALCFNQGTHSTLSLQQLDYKLNKLKDIAYSTP